MAEIANINLITAREMPGQEKAEKIERVMEENRKELEVIEKINVSELTDKINDNGMLIMLHSTLSSLCGNRPNERSERSRRYAVTITEMEKVVAYFKTFVIDDVKAEKNR